MKKTKQKNFPRSAGIYLKYELLNSIAFAELTRLEITVFMIFLLKRQFPGQKKAKGAGVDKSTVMNDGKIVFTYAEAKGYGINPQSFVRALDKLIRLGFIEITKPSTGHKDATLYGFSKRWETYGTLKHIITERPKSQHKIGMRFGKKQKKHS